ncbi:MAG TPA: helix-turn-helix domain-containing protein [Gammaproteobacteria bacterium]|nr:helix-turn-helix domain-containing protein [Gammaproteobacteria bacterium]
MHITILVPGHGLSSAVIGPLEVFSNTGVIWNALLGENVNATFEVTTASLDGKPVQFEGGITIKPDKAIGQIRNTDLIFIPTIGLDIDLVCNRNRRMIRLLQRQAARGTAIAGVCSGVAMLAEAGLLDGRPATTHWAIADEFRQRYPNVDWKPELFITEADNIFCGGGVYAALDLCLYLVERMAGYDVARQCGRALLIDAPRTWQVSFSTPMLKQQHRDEKILPVQEYLHEHFNTHTSIDELAQRAGMSARNFTRRFRQATGEPPLSYLHRLRINCARQLLETDFKAVQQVCYEVGYEDVPFFRKIFRRYTGLTPKEYKQRFVGRRFSGDIITRVV